MGIKYINNYSTTITSNITGSNTTIAVADTTGLPTLSTGDYVILTLHLSDFSSYEIIKVTKISGLNLTVERGFENTTAVGFISGTAISALVTASSLSALKEETNINHYTKTESNNLLDDKADKSDTYTKTEIDSNHYTKTETDTLLDDKADKSNTYTKTETDTLLDDKADRFDTYISLNGKADRDGNALNKFKVAGATADDEAVNKLQMYNAIDSVTSNLTAINNQSLLYNSNLLVGLGEGQTWQGVFRRVDVNYTNTTGRSIYVVVSMDRPSTAHTSFVINGLNFFIHYTESSIYFVIPAGATYKLNSPAYIADWVELR